MTLEELWQLFPIVLSPHKPWWKEWANIEIEAISKLLCVYKPVINLYGLYQSLYPTDIECNNKNSLY